MSDNPLLELAAEREVRLAGDFRKAAERLTGEQLAEGFRSAIASSPRRADAGKKYFDPHPVRRRTRAKDRDAEDLAAALVQQCRRNGKGFWMPKVLPDEPDHVLDMLDHRVPAKARREETGPSHLDLVALLDDRLALVKLKYVAPSAKRGSTGDTPLRALLEGLSDTAVVAANAEAMRAEIQERFGREVSEEPPVLVLLATERYWELCRKRSVQKGAQWIRELERLAREAAEACGVGIEYVGIELPSDPPCEIREEDGQEVPLLTGPAHLALAWEATAGRVRPKARPKVKAEEKDEIVEADPSRPPRPYRIHDSYAAGDSIIHPTLGNGVVQASGGPGKIQVLFDGTRKMLIHERA